MNEVFEFVGAVLCSIGGGAVVISVVAKWYGDFLAQKLLANIEYKHEKEIEKYKARLQDMSTKFNAIVEHSMQVASKQYDMEVEIYQNIWRAFHDLSMCLNYIYHFENPTYADPTVYMIALSEYCEDFKTKLEEFQKQIDSAAPFYQIESYDLLCRINHKYIELRHILEKSKELTGMTRENKDKINLEILPEIDNLKDDLSKTIREYLFSGKTIPSVSEW